MKQLFGALLLVGALVPATGAATISSVSSVSLPGPSTGTVGPVGATPAPNNDNTAAASPNLVPASIFFNGPGTAEIEFAVGNSGGTTEYSFSQSLVNNSGQTWSGFRFDLGFGTGTSFVPASSTSGLSFDLPNRDPAPSSSRFTVLDHQMARLDWSGAQVPAIGSVLFAFSVDVPDGLAAFHPAGLDRFTLQGTPIAAAPIPEPATLLLMSAGLGFVAWRGRRGS